jgi:molecular chaperone DnaK (HSP70)
VTAVLVTTERDISVEDPHLGHAVWPTSVAYDGVAPRVGGAADSFARVHPDQYQTRLKQLLGEPGGFPLGDATFQPTELVGWLLAGIREQAERIGGVTVNRAVITVPVGHRPGDPRRTALLDAAALAGFTTVELFYEPLAVVAAPITGGALTAGDIALVTDFGAGGVTATLVSVLKSGVVELLGFSERPECGGLEIDRMIMSELLSRTGHTGSHYVRPTADPAQRLRDLRARRALENTARAMKHQLSMHASAMELIGTEETPVEFTAVELNALVTPLLYKTIDVFRGVLMTAGVRTGELAAVLLSGGGSRLAAVADIVAETFHRPVRVSVDQHRAVVEGATCFARTTERRHVRARVATERETPLRWDIPGGEAFDLEWLVQTGARFGASDPLAVARLDDGSLWELRPGRIGTLMRIHAPNGSRIATGDWLVTVELDARAFR